MREHEGGRVGRREVAEGHLHLVIHLGVVALEGVLVHLAALVLLALRRHLPVARLDRLLLHAEWPVDLKLLVSSLPSSHLDSRPQLNH